MPLPRIQKGNVIRASFLNEMANGIDILNREFAARPHQILEAAPPEAQNQAAEEDAETADPATYIESGRTTSTVQVYDQNETNYAEVSRIEKVTFENALGETITLQFNNEA